MGHYTASMETTQQSAFAELIGQHRRIIFKVANTYGFHAQDRDDLAQEITAQLWRAFPGYDMQRTFSTWMYRIALNVAISHVRSSSRHGRHAVPLDEKLHDMADPRPVDPQAEQQIRALHRFIHAQEPLNRALLLLYLEDRSYRDMAEILGISETNVATKISRLKLRIRNEI